MLGFNQNKLVPVLTLSLLMGKHNTIKYYNKKEARKNCVICTGTDV